MDSDGHKRGQNQSGTGVPHSIYELKAQELSSKFRYGVLHSCAALVLATPVATVQGKAI